MMTSHFRTLRLFVQFSSQEELQSLELTQGAVVLAYESPRDKPHSQR